MKIVKHFLIISTFLLVVPTWVLNFRVDKPNINFKYFMHRNIINDFEIYLFSSDKLVKAYISYIFFVSIKQQSPLPVLIENRKTSPPSQATNPKFQTKGVTDLAL